MADDLVFEASNGVKLIPGGYRHADSHHADDASWLTAKEEARAAGFDLSYAAQRENAWMPDREEDALADAAEWKAAAEQETRRHAPTSGPILPDFPNELLALPNGLGALQEWIVGYMSYPSRACAGFTALAVLAHFAMASVKVDSRDGLGLNEQFLLLAPTGFGKEDLRKPFTKLDRAAAETWQRPPSSRSTLQFSAPASQQGLHRLLEQNRAQTFLADEFAEWLGGIRNDGHRQQALGHIMQAYTKAFGTLAAPAIGDREKAYQAVEQPRVQIFATSTAERLLEVINASQADSGALNRFLILLAEQERIPKRYGIAGDAYDPPDDLADLAGWIATLPEGTLVRFTEEAAAFRDEHDAEVLEPLKFSDPRLAGRLNEQALKIAALIALSGRRKQIDRSDLEAAYAVREGLYHRAASLIRHDGALSGMHPTTQALQQLRAKFATREFIYRSDLAKVSRRFSALSIQEQNAVERALSEQGIAFATGARWESQIFREQS